MLELLASQSDPALLIEGAKATAGYVGSAIFLGFLGLGLLCGSVAILNAVDNVEFGKKKG